MFFYGTLFCRSWFASVSYLRRVSLGYDADTTRIRHGYDLILSKLVRIRVVSVSYLRRVNLGYEADTTRIRTGATQLRHGYDTDYQKRQTSLSKIRAHRTTSNPN